MWGPLDRLYDPVAPKYKEGCIDPIGTSGFLLYGYNGMMYPRLIIGLYNYELGGLNQTWRLMTMIDRNDGKGLRFFPVPVELASDLGQFLCQWIDKASIVIETKDEGAPITTTKNTTKQRRPLLV